VTGAPGLAVAIATRNRATSLRRCLQSLARIGPLLREVVVVDDGSDDPVAPLVEQMCADLPGVAVRVIRHDPSSGYIVARNELMQAAGAAFVLLLDDDACLLDGEGVRAAVELMAADDRVAAVAFAQATAASVPWPAGAQPAAADYPCRVASFLGFAHLLRRSTFVALGGYRELFHYYGEEKEYSLRLLAEDFAVVYLPSARVAHVLDGTGRDAAKYLRYTVRNNCLGALYNEPLWLLAATVPGRLLLYFWMRRRWRVRDPGGFAWIVGQLARSARVVWPDRRPLKAATFRRWQALRRSAPPYVATHTIHHAPSLG
jgi:GT2 family glycosyltransferase